jgi:oligoendopeptidase F
MAKSRHEMQEEFTWDLSPMYASKEDFEKEYEALKKEETHHFPKINFYKSDLKNSLMPLLEAYFDHARKLDKLYTFAHLKNDEDLTETQPMEMFKKAQNLFNQFQAETAWIEPMILSLDEKILKEMMEKESAQPFISYLKKLVLKKAHILSEGEEKILAMASMPLGAISKAFSLMNNAEIKFKKAHDSNHEEHELTHGSYALYLKSYDRVLRKSAFENMHQGFKDFENTFSELLSGCVNQHDFFAKAKKYQSCLEASLFNNQIDTAVYHNLIGVTRRHLAPLRRYLKLRKKQLNVDKLHVYDLFVPIVEEVKIEYPYEKGVELVLDSLKPLGENYIDVLSKGLKNQRWTDVYENKGKRSGAYSSGCYDSYPYMLLNYQGTFSDVMTLSHEIGHSMHSYFSNLHQPYQDSGYSIFVAEVASTFNEELTFRKLLSLAKSKKERIYILSQKIDSIRSTLFRQTLFAEFELKIHQMCEKQIPITAQGLKELYLELNQQYYGDDLVLDPLLAYECLRIPHFYYNFYVYQYATGISCAYALAEKVLNQEEGALKAYLKFLSSGSSKFPLELLKEAGCDMTKEEPIIRLINRFDYLVDCLEKEFL